MVSVQGEERSLPMSRMTRFHLQLTKTATKAWLNDAAHQQSLGVKGMTCVWLVRPELLGRHGIPDVLPDHIATQLAKTSKRREQRQRAKQRAKDFEDHSTAPAAPKHGTRSGSLPALRHSPPTVPQDIMSQQAAYLQSMLMQSGNANSEQLASAEGFHPGALGMSDVSQTKNRDSSLPL